MKTIHKFLLSPIGTTTVLKMPKGAQLVKIDQQYGSPYAWVLVDVAAPYDQTCEVRIVGTGDEVPDGFWPFETFFELVGNAHVWHACIRWPVAASLKEHSHG